MAEAARMSRAARSAIRWRSGSAPSAGCRSRTRARWTPSSRPPRSRRARARSSRSTRAATCAAWRRDASSRRRSSSRCCCSRRAFRAPCGAPPGSTCPTCWRPGPRDVLVPESGLEAARDVLLQSDIEVTQAPHVAGDSAGPAPGSCWPGSWRPVACSADRLAASWLDRPRGPATPATPDAAAPGPTPSTKSRRRADDVVTSERSSFSLYCVHSAISGNAHRGKALLDQARLAQLPRVAAVRADGSSSSGQWLGPEPRGRRRPRSGTAAGRPATRAPPAGRRPAAARSRRPSAAFASRQLWCDHAGSAAPPVSSPRSPSSTAVVKPGHPVATSTPCSVTSASGKSDVAGQQQQRGIRAPGDRARCA